MQDFGRSSCIAHHAPKEAFSAVRKAALFNVLGSCSRGGARHCCNSIGSSSIFAAVMKSFSDRPPIACVHNSIATFL